MAAVKSERSFTFYTTV